MGWLSKLAGLTDVLKLDVLMSFDVLAGEGVAAFRWLEMPENRQRLRQAWRARSLKPLTED